MTEIALIIGNLYLLVIVFIIIKIILDKRDPVKSLSWIVVLILIPVFGVVLYLVFGQNMRRRRRLTLKEAGMKNRLSKIANKQMAEINNLYFDIFPNVMRNRNTITLLLNNNLAPLTLDNDITILNNAEITFTEIKRSLLKAKRFIHIEYYILERGKLLDEIVDILRIKAEEGIEVRIIFDDVGSWDLKKSYIRKLRSYGIKAESFMPVIFPRFTSRINHRNHRKIIVIDGVTGFTGGINIADRYLNGTKKLGKWRDTHMKLQGGAVLSLETIFIEDWCFCSKEYLDDVDYLSPINYHGSSVVQIASSGPDSDWASIMQAFFITITSANNHIYISTPYFIPNNAILTALKVASMSGVDVKIIIPEKADAKLTYWATRSYITELLDASIKVYRFKDGFNHSKIMMIDSSFSTIGTVNMDIRSFEANFEVTAMIYDKDKTVELEAQFLNDLTNSELITREMWDKNKKIDNLYEGLARLMSPLL